MSAVPSPAPTAVPLVERRRPALRVPRGLALTARTAGMLALVLLVPGEASRIGTSIAPRDARR
jgi:hypothetical protein